jgi:hypothetical protein
MIAIAAVSTPIPLDRVETMLPSPFAEPSDDATFRPEAPNNHLTSIGPSGFIDHRPRGYDQ